MSNVQGISDEIPPIIPGTMKINGITLGLPVVVGQSWVWSDPRIPGGQHVVPIPSDVEQRPQRQAYSLGSPQLDALPTTPSQLPSASGPQGGP